MEVGAEERVEHNGERRVEILHLYCHTTVFVASPYGPRNAYDLSSHGICKVVVLTP